MLHFLEITTSKTFMLDDPVSGEESPGTTYFDSCALHAHHRST